LTEDPVNPVQKRDISQISQVRPPASFAGGGMILKRSAHLYGAP